MARYYLDANALMRFAEGLSASPTSDQSHAAQRVDTIINDPDNDVLISEYTFIEFHDRTLRYRHSDKQEWDEHWLTTVQRRFMEWLEDGRIRVQRPGVRAIDVAMSYISMSRAVGASLKALDAIHLHQAIEWAHEETSPVTVVTGDRAFSRFLEVFPTARRFISIEEITVTQDVEPGTAST